MKTSPSLDLGIIGNCTVSALVDKCASVVWTCMPRFDGDPVFHALVDSSDRAGPDGMFAIELEGQTRSEQEYLPGTAVLRTRIYNASGEAIEVTDFAPRFENRGRIFRPMQFVRRVRPVHGHPRIRVSVRPRGNWGCVEPTITRGSNHVRYVLPELTLRLTTDAPITYVLDETPFSLHGSLNFILGPDETLDRGIHELAHDWQENTEYYWRTWTRRLALPYEWQEAVIRAAITLKLCVYEDTGAIVAAMTTSIPEAPGSQRNWDYRYCWLRDAFFVVRALNSLSEVGTMEDYLRWLHNIVRTSSDGQVQPLYGIGLEATLNEHTVDHLQGYRGMGPVRRGNQAYEHSQHDVYGNIVLGAAQAFHDMRLFRQANGSDFALFEAVGEQAWKLHDQPDAGMWELRTRTSVHTTSALMCWAACDRLAKIAVTLNMPTSHSRWRERADKIRDRILKDAWSEKRHAFADSFGGHDLDAGVLLMAEVGFIDANDKRFVSTVDALEKALCDGPFMRRYEAPDDFGRPETDFNICTFWRIDALSRIGRRDQAREIFEAMLSIRNHVGLLSEDTHPDTRELWGNFPQTYSMVGIINGAVRLSAPWDSVI
ncbi:MAG: glycoside hydrolase family 15 protein [Betaproteobacteria bacterium]|nr:glycoside hydrolase family 15 protein [Betaproteobacteria bacterium]